MNEDYSKLQALQKIIKRDDIMPGDKIEFNFFDGEEIKKIKDTFEEIENVPGRRGVVFKNGSFYSASGIIFKTLKKAS